MHLNKIKKLVFLNLSVVAMLFLSSCGYRIGSLMHPEIESIAIGQIINETTSYNTSVQLKQLLAEQFMFDGSLKVKSLRVADSIIYAKILSVSYNELVGRSLAETTYTPVEWEVKVVIEFSVVIPGEERLLIPVSRVVGQTTMQQTGDSDVARQRAVYMACRSAAEKMVQMTTEAW